MTPDNMEYIRHVILLSQTLKKTCKQGMSVCQCLKRVQRAFLFSENIFSGPCAIYWVPFLVMKNKLLSRIF